MSSRSLIVLITVVALMGPALAHGPGGHGHGHQEHNHNDEHDHQHHDECQSPSGSHGKSSYSVSMGIASIFIMFIISALGSLTPVLSARFQPRGPLLAPRLLEMGKHFGTGVILATGFIHMFPGAIFSLTDPCLPPLFRSYAAFAGLFAMLAALIFHLVEFVATQNIPDSTGAALADVPCAPTPPTSTSHLPTPGACVISVDSATGRYDEVKPRGVETSSTSISCSTVLGTDRAPPCSHSESTNLGHGHGHDHEHGHCHAHTTLFAEEGAAARRISTYLLEVGIALHSVLVGLALGTAEGAEFVSLLAALCFHQFFEGIALGSRIAELQYSARWMPIANALAYAITTPIGTALGVVFRSVYRARSPVTLIVQGALDAVSAGILIYTALVNLMAQEFAQKSFKALPRGSKGLYMGSLYLGAMAMSIIGIWA